MHNLKICKKLWHVAVRVNKKPPNQCFSRKQKRNLQPNSETSYFHRRHFRSSWVAFYLCQKITVKYTAFYCKGGRSISEHFVISSAFANNSLLQLRHVNCWQARLKLKAFTCSDIPSPTDDHLWPEKLPLSFSATVLEKLVATPWRWKR